MKPDPSETPAVWEEQVETRPAEAAEQTQPAAKEDLLDAIIARSDADRPGRIDRLEQFLSARTVGESLGEWLGRDVQFSGEADKERLMRRLCRDVAEIDQLLNEQLNAVLHHSRFQKLEASWRGLEYLTDSVSDTEESRVKIRVLNVSWKELERDFDRAIEFDQSQTFRKIYEEEFGTAGGQPFGMLVADYEIHPAPMGDHRHDDVSVLRDLARVGAAAFCPIVSNVSPAMLGMDDFRNLEYTTDHARTMEQKTFLRWQSLRDEEDSRFAALTLPHILMRLPYKDDGQRIDRFVFTEDVSGPDHSKYLWGGAAFALGGVVIRAFESSGWLADIRGARRGEDGGGIATGLPVHSFATDAAGVAPKTSTDVVVRETLEKELSELGFLPLCQCPDTEYSAFYSSQSIQKSKVYDRPIATINARVSAMLHYMLCASRFAHYLKVLGRDLVGTTADPAELQTKLHNWIHQYVTADSDADMQTKANYPLREARVRVERDPSKPGAFSCTMHLAPHYQLDDLVANVRLKTTLAAPST